MASALVGRARWVGMDAPEWGARKPMVVWSTQTCATRVLGCSERGEASVYAGVSGKEGGVTSLESQKFFGVLMKASSQSPSTTSCPMPHSKTKTQLWSTSAEWQCIILRTSTPKMQEEDYGEDVWSKVAGETLPKDKPLGIRLPQNSSATVGSSPTLGGVWQPT